MKAEKKRLRHGVGDRDRMGRDAIESGTIGSNPVASERPLWYFISRLLSEAKEQVAQ